MIICIFILTLIISISLYGSFKTAKKMLKPDENYGSRIYLNFLETLLSLSVFVCVFCAIIIIGTLNSISK